MAVLQHSNDRKEPLMAWKLPGVVGGKNKSAATPADADSPALSRELKSD